MAIPIKINIPAKSDYVARPSVPSSQKESAAEFNQVIAALRANYDRLIINWDTDIVINTTLEVGQYILYLTSVYRIIISYNVGSPITWNPANAILMFGTGLTNLEGGVPDTNYGSVISVNGGTP